MGELYRDPPAASFTFAVGMLVTLGERTGKVIAVRDQTDEVVVAWWDGGKSTVPARSVTPADDVEED